MRRTTPSSASVWIVGKSATSGMGMWGPTIMPATRYPKTTGWRSRWKITVVTPATQSTIARFLRNSGPPSMDSVLSLAFSDKDILQVPGIVMKVTRRDEEAGSCACRGCGGDIS